MKWTEPIIRQAVNRLHRRRTGEDLGTIYPDANTQDEFMKAALTDLSVIADAYLAEHPELLEPA